MENKELWSEQGDLQDSEFAAFFGDMSENEPGRDEQLTKFVSKLGELLPKVGGDEDKIIQIEVLVALSVEGIITVDNLAEKAPMIKAICEMIKFDNNKKATAIEMAKRLLKG